MVIDEYADFVISDGTNAETKKQADIIKASIIRLVQKGRAVGIHLVIATQRPTKAVIYELAPLFPTTIAFRTTSAEESKRIIFQNGAEKLTGCGDMLMLDSSYNIERLQGAYISREDVTSIVESIATKYEEADVSDRTYHLPKP